MKRSGLSAVLVLASFTAAAEWVSFGSTAAFTNYVDPAGIHRSGNIVTMWTLIDFKAAENIDGKAVMSMKMQREYDCKKDLSRDLSLSFHTGQMGGGELAGSKLFADNPWVASPPDNSDEAFWKYACGKKAIQGRP